MDRKYYTGRVESLGECILKLKTEDTQYAVARFLFGFAGLIGVFCALYFWSVSVLVGTMIAFAFFAFLVVKHQKVRTERRLNETLQAINKEELAYLNGQFGLLPTGEAYQESRHPFCDDLDVFGKGSLFQRINRSHNDRGQDVLARWLKGIGFSNTLEKQEAVKSLTQKVEWRQHFMAHARNLDQGGVNEQQLKTWSTSSNKFGLWTNPLVLWALSLWFPLLTIGLIFTSGTAFLEHLIYPCLLNAMIFFGVFKAFKKQHDLLDELSKNFSVYNQMILQLEALHVDSSLLDRELQPLKVDGQQTSDIMGALDKILNRSDSANNLFGAVVINGLMFYHLHVFRKLLLWKDTYAHHLPEWIRVVHRMEAYASLANYAFNHDEFEYPTVQNQSNNRFEAVGLGHPFLPSNQRVSNDIHFDEMKLVVLTGSNMAGKSTFLRSIGLSMVMSSLGLPVCSDELTLSPFHLLSSMKPQDDVNENTSYFQAEVNRLRMLMDRVERGEPCFLLLDEILRGTNSEDKRNGTRAFLKKLQVHNIKGVVATHDVDIAELANESKDFKNYFFESGYDGQDLTFDYRLREGVCASPNATQLLKLNNLID